MKIDKNAVIAFDMDGVLIDSKLSIFNALNSALGIFNIPKLDGSQVELIGLPLIEMLKRASEYKLNDDQLNVAMHRFRAYNSENGPKEAKPYEDIPRVLELLAQRFNLVVVTSKLQSAAIDLLHALDLVEHFFGIFGIQEDGKNESKKTILTRAKSCLDSVHSSETKFLALIGDRSTDISAAHEFKIKAVGALWGYGTETELRSADITLSTPVDILNIF
jgi:phosphoglycolate phosphatase